MGKKTVHVLTADLALRNALVTKFRAAPDEGCAMRVDSSPQVFPEDVVVAPTADCPPAKCAELTAAGAQVIILAPVPRADERERYLSAGAQAYIPMAIDTRPLLSMVNALGAC